MSGPLFMPTRSADLPERVRSIDWLGARRRSEEAMERKMTWWRVPKVLMDAAALVVFGLPAALASYVWCAIGAGWAFGEWSFDPDAFHRRYGGKDKMDAQIKSLRDTWRA